MHYSDWEPIYHQILADFNFDSQKDKKAGEVLIGLLKSKEILTQQELLKIISDQHLFIFGAGPTIETELQEFQDNVSHNKGVIIAADGATTPLIKNGIIPDIIVTDLDGYIPDQIKANEEGAKIIVHAHGDNISALKNWVPKFQNNLLGTTQAQPDEDNHLYNYGGFTDGDRAVFLSQHFKASRITLVAFDFDEIGEHSYSFDVKTKHRKLTWAHLLIGMVQNPPVEFYNDQE
jgi:uncharacterized Rossmann fold enzyme